MSRIEFEDGAICVEARIIADGFHLEPAEVQALMRESKITSLCERGMGADAGRFRLTFFHGQRRFRLLADESGTIIERMTDDAANVKRRHRRGA